MQIIHHGAVNGVTGSCHQLDINQHTQNSSSYLIDCGLFQGAETAGHSSAEQLQIRFDLQNIKALIVTHCHIDHVGRIPYLLAAGFDQPIYATTATAALLPLVIEDALKVGVTRDKKLIQACINRLKKTACPGGLWSVDNTANQLPHSNRVSNRVSNRKRINIICCRIYCNKDKTFCSINHAIIVCSTIVDNNATVYGICNDATLC